MTNHQTKAVVRSSPSALTTDSSTSKSEVLRCLRFGLSKSNAPLEFVRVEGVVDFLTGRVGSSKVVDALLEEGIEDIF